MRWPSLFVIAVLALSAGCDSGARAPAAGAGGQSGSTGGTGGGAPGSGGATAGTGGGGAAGSAAAGAGGAGTGGAGVSGQSGAPGQAGTSGAAGQSGTAGQAGTSGQSGAAGQAGTSGASGQSGAAGQAGASGAAGQGGQAGGGVFVMCDDHADFNGRGRCAATGKVGAVFAVQTLSAGGASTTLTATFGATSPPSDAGCTQQAAGGSCTAFSCPRTAGARAPGAQAGAISAKSNGGSLATAPNAGGTYDVAQLPRALWTLPKAALTFAAAGGATPAFGETFCGPVGVTLTKPAAAPGNALTIDRASDLAVQWTGGTVGDVELVFRDETAAPNPTLEVRCFFPTASGQGTVPKAALQMIGAGVHIAASYLWVREIGGGGTGTCVELTGVTTNAGAAGAPWNGNATFQ